MKKWISTSFFLVVLLIITVCPTTITAASTPVGENNPLFDQADYVVEGRVEQIASAWDAGGIVTRVVLAVSVSLKGDLDGRVTITHLGGQVGDIGMVVSTEPRFSVGEKARVYLVRHADGTLRVLWGSEGKVILSAPASVQFAITGGRWNGTDLPVPYYVHAQGTEDIADGSEFVAVQNAFQTWSDVDCSYMAFDYQGATETPPNDWGQRDGLNVVGWMDKADYDLPFSISPNTVAWAVWWNQGGTLIEFDIIFFEDWAWATTGGSGHDIESVALHEAGHALGLGHSTNSNAVMWHIISGIHRSLHQDDVDGVCYLYPHLDFSPASLTFLQDASTGQVVPPVHTVSIAGGAVDWAAVADEPWVEVSPTGGTSPSAMIVSLAEDTGGGGGGAMTTGTHVATVTVTGETGIVYIVPVKLIVAEKLYALYLPVVER